MVAKDTGNGLSPAVPVDELLAAVPELKQLCDLHTLQIFNLDSSNIQPENWIALVHAIEQHYYDYDGFVIVHGTDTMAYSCSALSYLIQNLDKPIVFTGSQKPIGLDGGDARKNLRDAFWFCVEGGVSGIFLVFNHKVILGTRASKVKTRSEDAFESINYPPLAYVQYGRPFSLRPTLPSGDAKPTFFHQMSNHVFLLKMIPGIEPDILDHLVRRYDVIVLESYGMGGLPFAGKRNFLERVTRLTAQGKIFVVATQVQQEGSDLSTYEVGVRALRHTPLLQSLDLSIESVVTKMMWILPQTTSFEQVKALFYQPVHHDIVPPASL